ncbi:hypothetical protein FRC09_003350 [Ceratobasidium sp. 395]|nr:hypothetical protein FRC09_003350 [Ceratobasidium sp. 395]
MQSVFRNIQVQPTVLQVDAFPVCSSPVFSSRLTVLRFFSAIGDSDSLDPSEWWKILSATPNLTELSLWHPGHGDTTSLPSEGSINLPLLRQLKLSGLFVLLSGLFARSLLPSLELLVLDSPDASGEMPQQITDIASVSPALRDLSIGSVSLSLNNCDSTRWVEPLRTLGSLKKLTFFEMEWGEITAILEWLDVLPARPALHIRFERIHDINLDDLDRKEITGYIASTVLVDCVEGQSGYCGCPDEESDCQSEDGSNYSDGSSFEYIYESTSEESTSDESEFNDGWDTTDSEDGPDNQTPVKNRAIEAIP